MKIPRCDIATHGLKGALRSQGGCRFSPPPGTIQIVGPALATVMGGQQVCIQTFEPCNDGGVIVTTQYQNFFPRKVDLARN